MKNTTKRNRFLWIRASFVTVMQKDAVLDIMLDLYANVHIIMEILISQVISILKHSTDSKAFMHSPFLQHALNLEFAHWTPICIGL